MKYFNHYCIIILSLLMSCSPLIKSRHVSISNKENIYWVVGVVELEEPVLLYKKIGNNTLSLITTLNNATILSKGEVGVNDMLRLRNVYLSGTNPLVLDSSHFRQYPSLGLDALGSRENMNSNVSIAHLRTHCFLHVLLDHETYRQTQMSSHNSYFIESTHDWVFLKHAFPVACSSVD